MANAIVLIINRYATELLCKRKAYGFSYRTRVDRYHFLDYIFKLQFAYYLASIVSCLVYIENGSKIKSVILKGVNKTERERVKVRGDDVDDDDDGDVHSAKKRCCLEEHRIFSKPL